MVKIRLRRVGKKKQPSYKIVVADSRASRNGKYIEAIGQYNPLAHPMIINVNETRLYSWLKRGAVPSDTTRSLLQRKGLWLRWGMMKKGADETAIAAALEKWQLLQGEKLEREAARKARRKTARKQKAAAETAVPVQAAPAEPTAAAQPAPAEPAPAPAATA
ncbi:MAG TPA: 30S ribosomal protein S16 [Bacteroidota bacterium]|nr:30S ribosomal protein S16 [Bacteroidota bacterium]